MGGLDRLAMISLHTSPLDQPVEPAHPHLLHPRTRLRFHNLRVVEVIP